MLTRVVAAVFLFLLSVSVDAQWTTTQLRLVDESHTQAKPLGDRLMVSVPIHGLERSFSAQMKVEWLDPSDKATPAVERQISVGTEGFLFETQLDLPAHDPLLARLHYRLTPDLGNLTAFPDQSGTIAFTEIAPFAYVLAVTTSASDGPGEPVDVHVIATNPKSGMPVPGVEVALGQAMAHTNADGSATLRISTEEGEESVKASLGGLIQEAEVPDVPGWPSSVKLSTDKHLYRPGQTLHMRLLALTTDGTPAAEQACTLEVSGPRGETVFAESLSASEFGIAHADWEIPDHPPSGDFKVKADCDDASTEDKVQIREYELPSFRVLAESERAFYLPGERRKATIHAAYLFGKALATGHVRVSAFDEGVDTRGANKKEKQSVGSPAIAEGNLDAEGKLSVSLDLENGQPLDREKQYEDLHFVASVTDTATNRTEQARFDIRVSVQPLNIYAPIMFRASALGSPAYVTVFSPDGQPAIAQLEALSGPRIVSTVSTNRFGLAKLIVRPSDGIDALRARSGSKSATIAWEPAAQTGYYEDESAISSRLQIQTDRALYGSGQPIVVSIQGIDNLPPGRILLWKGSELLFSMPFKPTGKEGRFTLRYNSRFKGLLTLGFASQMGTAARGIVFPQANPLTISVKSAHSKAVQNETYKPGQTVPLLLTARDASNNPVAAAFGVSIVDSAVIQRASVDEQFSGYHYGYFNNSQNERRYGGLTLEDLPRLDLKKVDADVQLAAEALLAFSSLTVAQDTLPEMLVSAFTHSAAAEHRPFDLTQQTDKVFEQTFRFPRNEMDLNLLVPSWEAVKDPWGMTYRPVFGVEGANRFIHWTSAGPDKSFDSADDLVFSITQAGWFSPFDKLVRNALNALKDLPSSPGDAATFLASQGVGVTNIRDPWGNMLRLKIDHRYAARVLTVESAGPDSKFDTSDDVLVEEVDGSWFRETKDRINAGIRATSSFPRNENEFLQAASTGGIDFRALRDPWGHPYQVTFQESDRYENRVRLFTEAEYHLRAQQRRRLEPITVRLRTIEVHSPGEDGVAGTYDDAIVASFESVITPAVTNAGNQRQPDLSGDAIAVTGTLAGNITDPTGAAISGASVTMDEQYVSKSDATGQYYFSRVPAGLHHLVLEAAGFQPFELSHVPVEAGKVALADGVLSVGNLSETVEVADTSKRLSTMPAAKISGWAVAGPTETAPVRSYFAETLLWEPELITDSRGSVRLAVKLADNITTWKVAVTASTLDGHTADAGVDMRAFQPFFADLDPPTVLTAGDEVYFPIVVRNYTDASQNVDLRVTLAPELNALQALPVRQSVDPQTTNSLVFGIRAVSTSDAAPIRVTARARKQMDTVERRIAVHPNGRFVEMATNDSLGNPHLAVNVPGDVIAGGLRGEIKFYPSVFATVLESVKSLLQKPHGCAEQAISAAYPNLLVLQLIRRAKLSEPKLELASAKNLQDGYTNLLSYRNENGSFAYWTGQKPDLALSAYAIEFLREASEFIKIEPSLISEAETWLRDQSPDDVTLRSLQIKALVALGPKGESEVLAQLAGLARKAQESDDPYAIATFVLAAIYARHGEAAGPAVQHLLALASREQGLIYWALRKNTPFFGYGNAGRIETTALAVEALQRWQSDTHTQDSDDVIDRALLFLVRQRKTESYWYSSQSTVRVLRALVNTFVGGDGLKNAADSFEARILVNGKNAAAVTIPGGLRLSGPVFADIAKYLLPGMSNHVEILAPPGHNLVQAQLAASWYEPWAGNVDSKEIAVSATYSTLTFQAGELVRCDVVAERPKFQGFGMMIADVGLPPASEVDRGTLAALVEQGVIDQFEVSPDHVVLYLWPRAGEMKFSFFFRSRLRMDARTAATDVFDYYNPEVRAVRMPQVFLVR